MRLFTLFMLLCTLLAADHDEYRNHHLPMDVSYLNLSYEQHEKVERIIREHQQAHHRFNRRKLALQEKVARMFTRERFDSDAFLELTGELRAEAHAIQARFLEEVHAVLTPKQRRLFVIYMEEWELE